MVAWNLKNMLALALMLGTMPLSFAEKSAGDRAKMPGDGYLPSLELPAVPVEESMTSVSELLSKEKAQSKARPVPKTSAQEAEKPGASARPAKKAESDNTLPVNHWPERPRSQPLPTMSGLAAETPAVHRPKTLEAEQKIIDKNLKPVSYSPLSAVAVFPVIKHSNEKAFGDLPIVFAREIARNIEEKAPDTRVFHPVYTVDELRMRGLGHLYDKMMAYYLKAGRPEPRATDYLLNHLTLDGNPISRIIFVEADLDMTHAADPAGPLEYFKALMTDGQPKRAKYHMYGRIFVFDATDPDFPELWTSAKRKVIDADMMFNVTPSVFQDSASHQTFSGVSDKMGREIFRRAPRHVYLEPHYDMSVQGRLAEEE